MENGVWTSNLHTEKYFSIFSEGIIIINIEAPHLILYANNYILKLGRILGDHQVHKWNGKNLYDVLPFMEKIQLEKALQALRSGADTYEFICRCAKKPVGDMEIFIKSIMISNEKIMLLLKERQHFDRYYSMLEKNRFTVLEWDIAEKNFFASDLYKNYKISEESPNNILHSRGGLCMLHKEDVSEFEQFRSEVALGKKNAQTNVRLKLKDGTLRWTKISAEILYSAGIPVRILATLLDIDDEMKAKEEVKATCETLRNIIDTVPAGIAIYEIGKEVLPVLTSNKISQMLGYTVEEYDALLKEGDLPCIPDISAFTQDVFDMLCSGKEVKLKLKTQKKNGAEIWIRAVCRFLGQQNGNAVCYAVLTDITEEVYEQQKKKRIYERYRYLSECNDVITFDYDVNADTMSYTLFSDVLGKREMLIRNYISNPKGSKALHSDDVLPFREALRCVNNGALRCMEIRSDFYHTGHRWYRARFVGIENEQGKVIRIVGRIDDIQYEKQRELNLMAAAEKEASLRLFLTANAVFSLQFDMDTGKRVLSVGEDPTDLFSEKMTLTELFGYIYKKVHPDDRENIVNCYDAQTIEMATKNNHGRISFDCRSESFNNQYSGYRWMGVNYIYFRTSISKQYHILIYIIDIHDKKTAQLELIDRSKRDQLTGLLNREAFSEYCSSFNKKRDEAVYKDGTKDLFILIDIDSFRLINATYGHLYGDNILKQVANTISAICAENVCARFGGNVFGVYMQQAESYRKTQERIRILQNALTQKLDENMELRVSFGVALSPDDGVSFEELYAKADAALNYAKERGGGQCIFYSKKLDDLPRRKRSLAPVDKPSENIPRVYIRTFGFFDVFIDGKAVVFEHAKAKELLAILVDRQGGFVSSADAISFLWEEESLNKLTQARYRKAAMWLKEILAKYNAEDIIESSRGIRRIIPEKVDCDLYNYLTGKPEYAKLFNGYYMTNYSWGEMTLSALSM